MKPIKLKFGTQLNFMTLFEILEINILYQIFESYYKLFQQLFDSCFNLIATDQAKIPQTPNF